MFNRRYIFKWWIFHCHVSFRGGIQVSIRSNFMGVTNNIPPKINPPKKSLSIQCWIHFGSFSWGKNLPSNHRRIDTSMLSKHEARTKQHVQVPIASFFLSHPSIFTVIWQLKMFLNFLGGFKLMENERQLVFQAPKKRERLLTCAKMNLFVWSKDGWTEPESNLSNPTVHCSQRALRFTNF